MRRNGYLIGAAALALAGCAPGDVILGHADRVARARPFVVNETGMKKIAEGRDVTYALSCPSGTTISDGAARVQGVTGLPGRTSDYALHSQVQPQRNRVVAVVRHTGPAVAGPLPRVIVAMSVTCAGPLVRG